eukprot:317865_1
MAIIPLGLMVYLAVSVTVILYFSFNIHSWCISDYQVKYEKLKVEIEYSKQILILKDEIINHLQTNNTNLASHIIWLETILNSTNHSLQQTENKIRSKNDIINMVDTVCFIVIIISIIMFAIIMFAPLDLLYVYITNQLNKHKDKNVNIISCHDLVYPVSYTDPKYTFKLKIFGFIRQQSPYFIPIDTILIMCKFASNEFVWIINENDINTLI